MDKRRKKKKVNYRVIATTILLSCTTLFGYAASRFIDEVRVIREYNNTSIEESNEATFTAISGMISSISLLAEDSLRSNIRFARERFTDKEKEEISESFKNGTKVEFDSKKLSDIYFRNYHFTHVDNPGNDIFICNENGIIADYSKDYESIYEFIPWNELSSKSISPYIKGDALDALLDCGNNGIIIYKSGNSKIYTMNDLRDIYKENGIDGFKEYNVLVPVYIDSDFNESSANYYVEMENYSIIIVQEFNIYDQIMYMQPDIGTHSSTGFNKDQIEEIISVLYMLGFCLLIGCIVFLAIIVHIHNGYICRSVNKGE